MHSHNLPPCVFTLGGVDSLFVIYFQIDGCRCQHKPGLRRPVIYMTLAYTFTLYTSDTWVISRAAWAHLTRASWCVVVTLDDECPTDNLAWTTRMWRRSRCLRIKAPCTRLPCVWWQVYARWYIRYLWVPAFYMLHLLSKSLIELFRIECILAQRAVSSNRACQVSVNVFRLNMIPGYVYRMPFNTFILCLCLNDRTATLYISRLGISSEQRQFYISHGRLGLIRVRCLLLTVWWSTNYIPVLSGTWETITWGGQEGGGW